jgi:two-component system, chemotaxis family, response regulator Rcp1
MISSTQVLLVEDNPADVDLMRDALNSTRFDIELSVAKDGIEAIDVLRGAGDWSEPRRPSLILLDLNMPRRDGRQLLALLKTQDIFRRIPAVVLSASNSESDILNCYDLGASCYIVKPDNLHDYRAVVRKLFDFWLGTDGDHDYIKKPRGPYVRELRPRRSDELRPSRQQVTNALEFSAEEKGEWFCLTCSERDVINLMRVMESR